MEEQRLRIRAEQELRPKLSEDAIETAKDPFA